MSFEKDGNRAAQVAPAEPMTRRLLMKQPKQIAFIADVDDTSIRE
jgi:hypothetical protein